MSRPKLPRDTNGNIIRTPAVAPADTMIASVPVNPLYTANARIMGRTYTAQGITPVEAVQNLKPDMKKGVCLLTIEGNGRKIEKILPGNRTMQLFGDVSRLTKEIAYKYIQMIFQ